MKNVVEITNREYRELIEDRMKIKTENELLKKQIVRLKIKIADIENEEE